MTTEVNLQTSEVTLLIFFSKNSVKQTKQNHGQVV